MSFAPVTATIDVEGSYLYWGELTLSINDEVELSLGGTKWYRGPYNKTTTPYHVDIEGMPAGMYVRHPITLYFRNRWNTTAYIFIGMQYASSLTGNWENGHHLFYCEETVDSIVFDEPITYLGETAGTGTVEIVGWPPKAANPCPSNGETAVSIQLPELTWNYEEQE